MQQSSVGIEMHNSLALGLMTILNWSGHENLTGLFDITPAMWNSVLIKTVSVGPKESLYQYK